MRRLNHPGGLIQKDRMVMLQCVISVCTCAELLSALAKGSIDEGQYKHSPDCDGWDGSAGRWRHTFLAR
jgi:hypothetical protein